MDGEQFERLIRELIRLPAESEWVEFKHNNTDPETMGENCSAIANATRLMGRPCGYIAWGVDNVTHSILGTDFDPARQRIKGQEYQSWLINHLTPRLDIRIHTGTVEGHTLVLFEIPAALHTPVRFRDHEYIRVGSYTKKLRDYPEKERALWASLSSTAWEQCVALEGVNSDTVLQLLAYPAYFDLTGQSLPDNRAGIIQRLKKERFIVEKTGGTFDITNLGAVLFAKDLGDFNRLARKGLRVVIYKGANRVETLREAPGSKGYALGFAGAIGFINDQLPLNEEIGQALRREVKVFPELAIRELVANALIHQDFTVPGTGPMVEIFEDRVEITNPGVPLIDTLRFIDEPPQSRNESLAAFMRRINICEERGSGIDKVIVQAEIYQLPAPDFVITGQHTKSVLYSYKPLAEMSREDKVRACYQHAALQFVSNRHMTNASLRNRFSIEEKNYSMASRIISDTIDVGLIKPADPQNRSKRHASYVPFWA